MTWELTSTIADLVVFSEVQAASMTRALAFRPSQVRDRWSTKSSKRSDLAGSHEAGLRWPTSSRGHQPAPIPQCISKDDSIRLTPVHALALSGAPSGCGHW